MKAATLAPTSISGMITWLDARRPRHIDFAVDGKRFRVSGFARVEINMAVGTQVRVTLRGGYVVEIEVINR